jgi:predicted MPP superfamily phosphohydrolase
MKRRTFFAVILGFATIGKWIANIIASEVKNAPKEKPQFTKMESFGDESPIRILALGDWGAGTSLQKEVAKGMNIYAEKNPIDFIISTGDNIYGKGVKSADDPQWKTKFEQVYTGDHIQKDWYPIFGNHDYLGNVPAQIEYGKINPRWKFIHNYYQITDLSEQPLYAIFMIDTNLMVSGKDKEMLEWLDQALSASLAKWKIVVGHHMIRSHGVYGDQKFMINKLKSTLDKYAVDIYLSGHDHDLQLIKHPDDKFYQAISGAGGGSRDTSWGKNSLFSATNGGFMAISIYNQVLYLEFLDKSGEVQFAKQLEK